MTGPRGHDNANTVPASQACARNKDTHDATRNKGKKTGLSQKNGKNAAASPARHSTTASTARHVLDPEKEAKIDQLLHDPRIVAQLVQGGADDAHVVGMRGLAERFLDACVGNVSVAAVKLAKHLVWREEYKLAVRVVEPF
jgi:hypothetical protein